MKYQQVRQLHPGDQVYVFTAPQLVRLLDRLFAAPAELAPDDRDFFGIFDVDPEQSAQTLAALYGIDLPDDAADASIAELIASRVGGRAEVGDRVVLDKVELIVREVDDEGKTAAAGLAIVEEDRARRPRSGIGRSLIDLYRRRRS